MKNLLIAQILNSIADILELQEVPFKPRAYRKAALTVQDLAEDIEEVYKRNELQELPGIGTAIAEKIEEIITTGTLKYYEDLKQKVGIDIEELNKIPFLGPKKIQILHKELGIKTIADLEKALAEHKLQTLRGFGEETEKKLAEGIKFIQKMPARFLYAQALPLVTEILHLLRQVKAVKRIEVAGSFRRGKETVGDLDFLAISDQPEKVMEVFTNLPDVQKVLAQGETKSSIRLINGLQVDLRVVQEKAFGSAMNYFIGSKEHNVTLRSLALKKGYSLSEYGLFSVKDKKWLAGRTEEEIYQKLGLQFIAPELRENQGEIEAAQQQKVPTLIVNKDINGVFHNHSLWSDGTHSLLEMAQQAETLGFAFISFNDHCGPMGITMPVTEKRLDAYLREIASVRKKVKIRVFSGLELDILRDGTLPLPREKLKQLDIVIASVHLAQNQPEEIMTQRVISVIKNYPIHILGHPTGRIIGARKPIALNLEKVFAAAKAHHVFLEINASPARMDLESKNIKAAVDLGCKFALSTDAHDKNHLAGYVYGVINARRGWLEKKDVLNCWSLNEIEKALKLRTTY